MNEVERLTVQLAMSEAIAASRARMVDFMTEYADIWHAIADSRLEGATDDGIIEKIEAFRDKWIDAHETLDSVSAAELNSAGCDAAD